MVSPGTPDDGLTLMLGRLIDAVALGEGVGTDPHPTNISINPMKINIEEWIGIKLERFLVLYSGTA